MKIIQKHEEYYGYVRLKGNNYTSDVFGDYTFKYTACESGMIVNKYNEKNGFMNLTTKKFLV